MRRALVFTVAVALALGLLARAARGRFEWGPAEFPPKAQCEALDPASLPPPLRAAHELRYQSSVATAVVREPQNTWSNLAFVFAGALIFIRDRRVFSRLLGAALVALGLASGLYHASLSPGWRTIDVAAMAWTSFALCCVGYAAARGTRDGSRAVDLTVGIGGATLAITAAVFRNEVRVGGMKPFDTTVTTVAGIACVFLLAAVALQRAARARPSQRPPAGRLGMLAALVGLAAICQLGDRPGRWFCAPDAAVQAHAVWHGLMAAAAVLAYDFFAVITGRPSLFSWHK